MSEINDALGRSYATPSDVDEADLEAELSLLEDELDADHLAADAAPSYLAPSALPEEPAGGLEEEGGGEKDEFGLPIAANAV